MSVNGEHDIEGLKCIGAVVAAARDAMATHVVPGVTTAELDYLAVGYASASSFSTSFAARYGMPPSQVARPPRG